MGNYFLPTLFIAASFSLCSLESASTLSETSADSYELADCQVQQTAPACPAKTPDYCFCSRAQIGANYTYAHITPSGEPTTTGNLGGLQALYEFKTVDRLYGGLSFAFRDGNTTGDGGSRSILMFDVEERIGYTFGEKKDMMDLVLFTGFGYRYYGEDVKNSGNSVNFYYNEFYVPVGFLCNHKFNCNYAIGLNGQWMPQVYPTVTIDPLKGARWIITNQLANFRVEVPFTAVVSCRHRLSVIVQPFFEYWKDGHTTAKTTSGLVLGVPGNTYLFAGVDLNLRYSF